MREETIKCDFCGEQGKTLTLTIIDNELKEIVNKTDMCEKHFNLLRSYIRHGMPSFKSLN